ncbi:hypothetical protein PVAP13_4KG373600 [Panicum virgatum]|uniref:Biogenesis of lysosome-related organelles complex 1 subunit 1 n=1 Tax=Panicum virgatum TaxID=38727 RepID=A0A8T0TM73_PANVG|nr:hypothetical protein PVAP13_4KG373600 [Panicum virgatum]
MDRAKPPPPAGGKQELEEALLHIIQQHHHQSLRQRQQTGTPLCPIPIDSLDFDCANFPQSTTHTHTHVDRAKNDALRSAVRVSDLLVDTVDGGVQELFVNERRIEHEARALLTTIARYRKQTDQWLAATNEINSVLKEIGDFENWMKIMDFDCKSINAAIRNIHQS